MTRMNQREWLQLWRGIYLRWQLSLLQERRILRGPKANDRVLQRMVYPHAVGAGVELSVLRCRISIGLVKKIKNKCWFERSTSAVSRMRKREREMSICYCWVRAGVVKAMTRSVSKERREEVDTRWEDVNRWHLTNLKIEIGIITSKLDTIQFTTETTI